MERLHASTSFAVRRMRALATTRSAPIASALSNVDVELLVDGERERLRDALERAREHDRRAELSEPARERERRAGAEPSSGKRKRDTRERPPGPGAERARGGDEIGIHRLERGDRRAHVEGAGDERDCEHDGDLREGDVDSERRRAFRRASPSRPNAASRPMPATAGGSTRGSSTSVTSSALPRKLRVARR